ncbi:pyridoxamine 5'-phosphate oxidase [bacterium]|nr:pyridoxamine 5'-phosphate oxidase [bacterium]
MTDALAFGPDIDPIDRSQIWVTDSHRMGDKYPDAACLSTIRPDGYPDGRMVLVRYISDAGFVFFTNSQSMKGQSVGRIPKASLTFYWRSLGRQLRVHGDVEPVTDQASDDYFNGRFLISQLGAWASEQSRPVASRDYLLQRVEEMRQKFDGGPVPRPPHWIGYCIVPRRIEFWIEGDYRLHDRFEYSRHADGWSFLRLNP